MESNPEQNQGPVTADLAQPASMPEEISTGEEMTMQNAVTQEETQAIAVEPSSKTQSENTEPLNYTILSAFIILAVIVVAFIIYMITKRSGKKQPSKNQPASGKKGEPVEIYVGNLSYDMKDEQLRKEFERYGIVKSARIITQRSSRKSKGYGFVEMPHRKEAQCAIQALNNKEIMGRKLHVNEARANTRPSDK